MTQQIIEIVISPKGETKVETKGFAGASCRDSSKFIEVALGSVANEQLTAEFYMTQPNQQALGEVNQ